MLYIVRLVSFGLKYPKISQRSTRLWFRSVQLNLRSIRLKFVPYQLKFRSIRLNFLPTRLKFRNIRIDFLPYRLNFRSIKLNFLPTRIDFRSIGLNFLPNFALCRFYRRNGCNGLGRPVQSLYCFGKRKFVLNSFIVFKEFS